MSFSLDYLCNQFIPEMYTSTWSRSLHMTHQTSDFRNKFHDSVQIRSDTQSCLTLQPHEPQHTRPPCPLPTPGVHPNPCPLSWWCHPTIPSSVVPFFSCLQSFPALGSFPMSQFFTLGHQNIGVSASASVLPTIQNWFPLGWTGWISLQSKGLSRVFSNTRLDIAIKVHF